MYVYADRHRGRVPGGHGRATRRSSSLSDHGFELGALPDDPSKTRDMRRVSERFHRVQGIALSLRPRREARARSTDAEILDVAPTVLALAGVRRRATCRAAC